jgi:hypothetical protein
MEDNSPKACEIASGLASPNSLGQIIPQMSFSPRFVGYSIQKAQNQEGTPFACDEHRFERQATISL